jgi:hypothetical protein
MIVTTPSALRSLNACSVSGAAPERSLSVTRWALCRSLVGGGDEYAGHHQAGEGRDPLFHEASLFCSDAAATGEC